MKKSSILLLMPLVLMSLLLFTGCQNQAAEGQLKVYLVEASGNKLLFTDQDIKDYDQKTHEITFTEDYLKRKSEHPIKSGEKKQDHMLTGGSQFFGTTQQDKFKVMVNDEVIYGGSFEQAVISSWLPTGAMLLDTEHGVRIDFIADSGTDIDMRSDHRIISLLEKVGKLRK